MSQYLPTRSFQIYQIFAPNTNVGKTIISAGLLNAFSKSPSLSNKYNRSGNSNKADAYNSFEKLFYVKPVQTGYPTDSDARLVKDCLDKGQEIQYKTLYEYEQPVSPHLAIGNHKAPSDKEVLENIKSSIAECKRISRNDGLLILETAGGVNSPIMSGTPQSMFYRPLRLPTIVIGDSKLGGISTTLSAFESLHLRGYDILSILFFTKPDKLGDSNFAYFQSLAESFNSHHRLSYRVPIFGISSPPERKESRQQDLVEMRKYFKDTEKEYDGIIKELRGWYNDRFDRLEEMEEKTNKVVWWPFTQHQNVEKVTVIDSAYEDFFVTYRKDGEETTRDGEKIPSKTMEEKNETSSDSDASKSGGDFKELFDGCASWWTQGLGHGSQRLSLSTAYAAGRYGHVMFPECIHEPALAISESLLSTVGRPWANRVFFSDNGSTAMEVALKMGLRAFEAEMEDRSESKGNEEGDAKAASNGKHLEVLGINGSYHGDTIGAMDACGPNVFNEQVGWYKPRGYWFDPPMVLMKDGVYRVHVPPSFTTATSDSLPSSIADAQRFTSLSAVFSQTRDSSALADFYRSHITSAFHQLSSSGRTFGALVMEPVVMGAGGMIFVDPVFQRCLVDCARSHDWGRKKRQYQADEWKGLPVIFDEVYTGLWRLGRVSGAEILGVNPDIASYAKLLTGGLLPLAVTLATENIFSAFSTPHKTDALLHGHSYTAHPIGCWVAKTSLDEYAIMNKSDGSWNEQKKEWIDGSGGNGDGNWSMWSVKTVDHISRLASVKGVFALGTLLAVHLESSSSGQGYASNVAKDLIKHLRSHSHDTISSDISNVDNEYGIFARPLGDVVYFMTSLVSNRTIVNNIERMIVKALESL